MRGGTEWNTAAFWVELRRLVSQTIQAASILKQPLLTDGSSAGHHDRVLIPLAQDHLTLATLAKAITVPGKRKRLLQGKPGWCR